MHDRSKSLHLSPNSAYSICHFLKLSLLFIPSSNPKKDMSRFHTYLAQNHILLTYLTQALRNVSFQVTWKHNCELENKMDKQLDRAQLSVLFVSRGEFDIVFVFIKNLKHAN